MSETPVRIYEFGPFRVDAPRRMLLRDDNPVRLPAKAFEILLVLLEHSGRLVEKDELMRRVWSDSIVEESNLTVNMSALRKSLAESPGEHRYVVTVPGRGYQFVADVRQYENERAGKNELADLGDPKTTGVTAELAEAKSAPKPHVTDKADKPSTTEQLRGQINLHNYRAQILLTALLATTVVVAYVAYSRHPVPSNARIRSIAVLPFANQTGDPNAEYLSDGISESLINNLSKLPDVKVIARSSAFTYKGKEVDLDEVANALAVDAVLTGRVRQRGDSLSISVELVNARDKTQIWGEQYDRKMSDLLAIQREIAREIVERLKLRVSGEERGLAKHYTESNEAYQLYLNGRFHWNKRTAEGLKKSIEYFNQAIEKDPSFALAYAGLADSYVVPANRLPPREAMPKAKAAAMRALELDETLAEAHASLGRVFAAYDWDWTSAAREYKRAIELNPRYAVAHQWYGGYFDAMGRHNEAIAERKLAQELDPLSLIINFELGLAFYYARDYDQAIAQFRKTLELDQNFPPAHALLPAAYEQKGKYGEAIAEFENAIPLKRGSEWAMSKAGLGHVYAISGKKREARKELDELTQLSGREYVPPPSIALIYAGLGEKNHAFAWLEKAYEDRSFQLQWLKIEPRWDSLRPDPRFQELMRRLGLPQ